jgi:hypothetical protein
VQRDSLYMTMFVNLNYQIVRDGAGIRDAKGQTVRMNGVYTWFYEDWIILYSSPIEN